MRVARILSESASDAAPLAAQLRDLGYVIEIASPNSEPSMRADVEIQLQPCNRKDVLNRARVAAAQIGADVYVLHGSVRQANTETSLSAGAECASLTAEQLAPSAEVIMPEAAFPGVADPLRRGVSIEGEQSHPFRENAPESTREIPTSTSPLGWTDISAAGGNSADVRSGFEALPEDAGTVFASPAPPDVIESAATYTVFGETHQNVTTNQFPPPEAPRRRVLVNFRAAATAVCGTLAATTKPLARVASRGAAFFRQEFANRIHGSGQRRPGAVAGARPHATVPFTPSVTDLAPVDTAPAPLTTNTEPPTPVANAVMARAASSRPVQQAQPLPWLAFAAAGAAAVGVLLGWSVLAGRPAGPEVPLSSGVEQQLPFGPVKIIPRSAAAQPASAANSAVVRPVEVPVPPSPEPVMNRSQAASAAGHDRAANSRRVTRTRARAARITDDEVIVHHYGQTKPASKVQVSSSGGVKHISDQP